MRVDDEINVKSGADEQDNQLAFNNKEEGEQILEQDQAGKRSDAAKVENSNPTAEGAGLKWYSIYVQSGCEAKAIEALNHRIAQSKWKHKFGEILLPKIAEGDNQARAKKIMPGYIFIEMEMNDDTWELVRKTPKVLGFIGGFKNPPPIPEEEISRIKEIVDSKGEVLKQRLEFFEGEIVTVIDGPFKDFVGKITSVDNERSKLTVEISILGRQTPVVVDFAQVSKK
ncbi:MAG: transcription termination/antitermination protein NusG [Deltaproteobacteria bacterium]|nr:transcription termination/antitermination protein NusG [Deltaproteobacteria bacterium]